jgi:hypothetical protein
VNAVLHVVQQRPELHYVQRRHRRVAVRRLQPLQELVAVFDGFAVAQPIPVAVLFHRHVVIVVVVVVNVQQIIQHGLSSVVVDAGGARGGSLRRRAPRFGGVFRQLLVENGFFGRRRRRARLIVQLLVPGPERVVLDPVGGAGRGGRGHRRRDPVGAVLAHHQRFLRLEPGAQIVLRQLLFLGGARTLLRTSGTRGRRRLLRQVLVLQHDVVPLTQQVELEGHVGQTRIRRVRREHLRLVEPQLDAHSRQFGPGALSLGGLRRRRLGNFGLDAQVLGRLGGAVEVVRRAIHRGVKRLRTGGVHTGGGELRVRGVHAGGGRLGVGRVNTGGGSQTEIEGLVVGVVEPGLLLGGFHGLVGVGARLPGEVPYLGLVLAPPPEGRLRHADVSRHRRLALAVVDPLDRAQFPFGAEVTHGPFHTLRHRLRAGSYKLARGGVSVQCVSWPMRSAAECAALKNSGAKTSQKQTKLAAKF